MQKQKRNVPRATHSESAHFAAHIAVGVLAGLAAAAALLCAIGVLRCKIDLASQLLSPLSTTALCIAVILAGLIFASLRKEKGLLHGFVMGGIFFVILVIAALMRGQREFSSLSAIKGLALLFSGAIGGFCGIVSQERRRRIHK